MLSTGVILLVLGLSVAYGAPPSPLVFDHAIPLEHVKGRIDHMALDGATNRLYVAALGNDTVEVVDLKAGKRVGEITGLHEPQGIVVVPDPHILVVASGGDGRCVFFDAALKRIGALDHLDDADNVRFDADSKRVYVGYGGGGIAVIDPSARKIRGDIKLGGHPESFQLESRGQKLFVNVPDSHEIGVIARDTGRVIADWPIDSARANFPMALDETNHRLFVGCRHPARLLVLDTTSGKQVGQLDCCGDADDVFYDRLRSRIYISGGEGCVTVIQGNADGTYKLLDTVPTAAGARTSLFDPTGRRLYVAAPSRGGKAAEIRIYTVQ